jgi:hypothetical protein
MALETILGEGPLARRLLAATGESPGAEALRRLQERLANCLRDGVSFSVRTQRPDR